MCAAAVKLVIGRVSKVDSGFDIPVKPGSAIEEVSSGPGCRM